jgi:hypothetical protein
MRTPAGTECRHYYQDFHRGRNLQECRLIQYNPESLRWQPPDCTNCPVPAILRANACKDMELQLTMKPRLLGMGRRRELVAICTRDGSVIEDPFTSCGNCSDEREGLDIFRQALEQSEDDD